MSNKTIIIADDEASIRQMYQDRLKEESFDVIFAEDGEQAIDLINKTKPVLALLDIMMPKKTGMEVLEMVKKDSEIADTIIGILTVLDEDSIRDKAFDLGAKYYLVKSKVTPSEVVEIIKKEISEV